MNRRFIRFAVAAFMACMLVPTVAFAGTNLISFSGFTEGDIVVVADPSSVTGHAGMYCQALYSGMSSYAMISANTSPKKGVQYETCQKYRGYEQAWGLRVKNLSYANRLTARKWAQAQLGKPYNLAASKTDYRSFYCSKLCWGAFKANFNIDIDGNGGTFVAPSDIIIDGNLSSLGYWK